MKAIFLILERVFILNTMYQEYFGLKEMPFHVTPNPRFLYMSPIHEEAVQHLRYGIKDKKVFIVLAGEVCCGKTSLC